MYMLSMGSTTDLNSQPTSVHLQIKRAGKVFLGKQCCGLLFFKTTVFPLFATHIRICGDWGAVAQWGEQWFCKVRS